MTDIKHTPTPKAQELIDRVVEVINKFDEREALIREMLIALEKVDKWSEKSHREGKTKNPVHFPYVKSVLVKAKGAIK